MENTTPTCEGCAWTEQASGTNRNPGIPECKRRNEFTGMPEMCDVDCYLPYPVEYFNGIDDSILNTDSNRFMIDGLNPGVGIIDPAIVAAQEFIEFHSNETSINPAITTNTTNIKPLFMCGSENPLTTGQNFPALPDREKLYSLLSVDKRSAYYRGPIKWDKIADTPLFREIKAYNNEVGNDFATDFNGLIDNDGVHLEWYNIDPDQLLTQAMLDRAIEIIPDQLLRQEMLETIPNYTSTTKVFLDTFVNIIHLPVTTPPETSDTPETSINRIAFIINKLNSGVEDVPLYLPESIELRRSYEDQRGILANDLATGSTGLQGGQYVPINIEHFIDIFMITTEDVKNSNLEENLNTLLKTGDHDTDMLLSINNHTSIQDLGSNHEHLKYIERKIKKFLGTDTEEFVTVFESHVNYENLCSEGFSTRPMEILGNLLKLNVDGDVDEQGFQEEKRVFKMLLKYVPSLIKKVLEISEELEMFKCDAVTKKTRLYREIYRDLFINSNVLKFELPDLGISEFFSDFNKNIYTKIILLIFIGFIISRIISLFSVNVGVKV